MVSLAIASLFVFAILIFRVLYLFFISPLSRIPAAHFLARFTSLWILYIRYRRRENATILAAHNRLGPVVLLGPAEVSVNCVKGGLSKVYTGGMEKGDWYDVFSNYGFPNMFSTAKSKPHSLRKRMLSNVYSKSFLHSSAPLEAQTKLIVGDRIMPRLSGALTDGPNSGEIDIHSFICAATMDFVTAYAFGISSSSKFLFDELGWKKWYELYVARHAYTFYVQETGTLSRLLGRIGIKLVPEWVGEANRSLEEWMLGQCDQAQTVNANYDSVIDSAPETVPVVYRQLRKALEKDDLKSSERHPHTDSDDNLQKMIASELLDHVLAGFDTSGITLTYLVHEMSRDPEMQARLRRELLTLQSGFSWTSSSVPNAKALDALPLLHAIIWETLRRHAAIPGPEPRITPSVGCTLGPESPTHSGYQVPGGVRVSASAGALHANEDVYADARRWDPDRWLTADEKTKAEMDRWFWAFGSGGRMCIGSNLALYQMKYIVGSIYSNFITEIVNDDGITQEDAYTARPEGARLDVRLRLASDVGE